MNAAIVAGPIISVTSSPDKEGHPRHSNAIFVPPAFLSTRLRLQARPGCPLPAPKSSRLLGRLKKMKSSHSGHRELLAPSAIGSEV